MSSLPDTVNSAVKSLVCPKVKLPHMQREIYNPSCLTYCSELCGSRYHYHWLEITNKQLSGFRCKGKCNQNHNACSRGTLPLNMVNCPTSSAALFNSTLNYVSFESRSVETFNKGVPYTTMEKVETPTNFAQFLEKFR